MFSAKDNDDSFVRKHTHHTTGGGAGGERSELHDSHGRKSLGHQEHNEFKITPDRHTPNPIKQYMSSS